MSENRIELREEQIELIERLSGLCEAEGMQPAMGKIMALLTISDNVELTFDQIKETLDFSKSAVSQALNQLLMTKKITYKTKIGDRKRYFHIRIADWENHVMEQFEGLSAMVDIYKKIVASRTPETKEFNQNLGKLVDFLEFINIQVVVLYKKFLEEKNK